jgi:hypothetical protein
MVDSGSKPPPADIVLARRLLKAYRGAVTYTYALLKVLRIALARLDCRWGRRASHCLIL